MSNSCVRLGLAVWVVSCLAIAAGADGAATAASLGGGESAALTAGGKVNTAVVPAPGGSDTWRARHKAMNARAKEGHVDLPFIWT